MEHLNYVSAVTAIKCAVAVQLRMCCTGTFTAWWLSWYRNMHRLRRRGAVRTAAYSLPTLVELGECRQWYLVCAVLCIVHRNKTHTSSGVRQPALDPAEDVEGTQKDFIVSFVLMVTVSYPN